MASEKSEAASKGAVFVLPICNKRRATVVIDKKYEFKSLS